MARCFALGAEAPHVKTADTNLDCVLVNMSFFKLIVDAENPREKNRVIGQTWRGRNPGSAMPTIWRSSISSPGGPPGTLEPEKAPLLSSTPPSHASNCLQLPPAAGSPPPPTPPPPCQRLETQREPGNEKLLEPGCWQAAQAWDKGNHLHLITTKAVFLSTRKWGKSEKLLLSKTQYLLVFVRSSDN